jgi:Xaa-Pro aminopeptidase
MIEDRLQGVILVPGPNLRYYTGINSMLLERPYLLFIPRNSPPHLIAPTLESGPFQECPFQVEVHSWTDNEGPTQAFESATSQLQLDDTWGVEGRTPFRFLDQLMKFSRPQFQNAEASLQRIREIKDEQEVRYLRHAASMLSESFLLIPSILKPSLRETELAGKIAQAIQANGAETVGEILVQTGKSSADPHHIASSRRIRRKDPIVIDTTCTFAGYYADITRTFMLGSDNKFEDMYSKVLEAQIQAIEESKPAVKTGAVDQAARENLRRNGLDKYFIHRTGHGLGLEVHEAPYIIENGTEILQPKMAFTIEPGIYVPSKFGIRIEDNIITTNRGSAVLTNTLPKEYAWWK